MVSVLEPELNMAFSPLSLCPSRPPHNPAGVTSQPAVPARCVPAHVSVSLSCSHHFLSLSPVTIIFVTSSQVQELEPKLHMYIMSLLAHFRSGWTELKGTAALLVGESTERLWWL